MPMVTAVLVAFMLLAGGAIGPQQRQQDIDLQAAIRTESVDGDLNGAIKQYRTIVEKYAQDRAVVATALVRMAECYQKLGNAEATKIYEQLVRDYPDQKEAAAVAQLRLGSSMATRSTRMALREVWSNQTIGPEGMEGTVSPDGRFISYTDWNTDSDTGELALHDLATGGDRRLTNTASDGRGESAGKSAISRDGKQIAYGWYNRNDRYELRLLGLQSAGFPQPRRLLEDEDLEWIAPSDWSPDGRFLVVQFEKYKDPIIKIGIVAVGGGSLRMLKSIGGRGADNIFFSPDSRYIAYSAMSETLDETHVTVMAIDGSRDRAVIEHPSRNIVMGWSPDGASLLFASDRSGSFGLWRLSVNDGQPEAIPTLLRADIGRPRSLGVTPSGGLYFVKEVDARNLQVASIDLSVGRLLPATAVNVRLFVGSGGNPAWSADGKYLAYQSCRPACAIAIRSMENGLVRELPSRLSSLNGLAWSRDGRSLIGNGFDLKGRRGIYQVDAQTGEMSLDTSGLFPGQWANLTTDGQKLYAASGGNLVEKELSSGKERVIFKERAPGNSVQGTVMRSPDARFVAFVETGTKVTTLFLMPLGGGEPKELLRATAPEWLAASGGNMTWTRDSRALILMKTRGQTKELWLVPTVDGAPRKLDIDVDNWILHGGGFRLRPDERQIAFVTGETKAEVWALENFLPSRKVTK